ncbi:MAG: hypothetical protein A3J27_14460 [Candidatus Tectomicrobia bacterium RIFCSPLOWO2_12_FULL_69_37]|nr:MAG: hypothetical protein A3I72_14165 [Candidatus Tectomicrobia bacterium RIFCSPLOWO2_02_FULL_70_19]OGL62765.1 MAG: hypothetical protein A3J27_14460 [Candidatus Tectomicrobia bacterium RIFCSPLOWO2_12_FULL_69_37]
MSFWAVRLGVLVVLASGATYWDLRSRRVPDFLTFSCALAGLLIGGLEKGGAGLLFSASGLVLAGGVFFPFVVLGYVGAGDLKLLAAAGSLLGPVGAVWAVLLGSVLGGVWALAWLAVRGREKWLPYAPPLATGALVSFFIA